MKRHWTLLLILLATALVSFLAAYDEKSEGAAPDAVATITKLENDAVKADLAGDSTFYEKYLADDWTGGTSRGTWDNKQSLLADFKDAQNNKTNSENISDLKVRANGDIAVATYRSTYDSMIRGKHYARTIISTDVFRRQGGTWKQIASHSSRVEE